MLKSQALTLLFFCLYIVSFGQKKHSPADLRLVEISKKPMTDKHSRSSKLLVQMILTSTSDKKIKVRDKDFLFLSEFKDFDYSDGYFEVHTTTDKGSDSTVKVMNDCDFLSASKNKVIILSKNQSITYSFDLACYYQFFANHSYKVRFCYKLSTLNPAFKDIFSDWVTVKF